MAIILVMPPRYELIYAEVTYQHISAIERPYHSLIRQTIEQQLSYEPNVRTRNGKPLVKPARFGQAWELRFDPDNRFRVFYSPDEQVNHIESCKTSPVVVTKNGKPAAVLVSVADDDELESILLACSPRFQKLLERSSRQIDQGKGIPHDEFWKRVERNQ
jgi:PHD/YefM family antitoxin component YafN of YafNO toxin-antitoxin module